MQTGNEPDPRHAPIRELIQSLYLERFKVRVQWDGSEAKVLDRVLESNPTWTVEQMSAMVRIRFDSQGITSARPRKWLPDLGTYAAGPLDRYGKVDEYRPTRQDVNAALGTRRHQSEPQELVPSIDLPSVLDREAGTAEWKLAQGKLGERLNVHTYETWIKPTRGEGVNGDTLYVCVPTSEFEVIGDRFNREIREALPDHIAPVKYFYLAPAPAHQSN
jgi:hypothetical protein